MSEEYKFELVDNQSFCLSSWCYVEKIDTTKIWVKLTPNAVSFLDKFYRDLDGGSSNRTSPFYIYTKHRFYKGYFEFYQMEYDQIFKGYTFDNIVLTEKEFYDNFKEDATNICSLMSDE